jgi:hypothetical protein
VETWLAFRDLDKVRLHILEYFAHSSEIGIEEGYSLTAALINNGHEIHGYRIL